MRKVDTGAALVLAVGIVAILLAIGFTFYFVQEGNYIQQDCLCDRRRGTNFTRVQ